MSPAAPRDPVVTRVLLYTAGALFLLNFCVFAAGVSARSSHEEAFVPLVSPAPCCVEIRLIPNHRSPDAVAGYDPLPDVRARIEILRRRIENQKVVAPVHVQLPIVVESL